MGCVGAVVLARSVAPASVSAPETRSHTTCLTFKTVCLLLSQVRAVLMNEAILVQVFLFILREWGGGIMHLSVTTPDYCFGLLWAG